jgi:hypothetical protein
MQRRDFLKTSFALGAGLTAIDMFDTLPLLPNGFTATRPLPVIL